MFILYQNISQKLGLPPGAVCPQEMQCINFKPAALGNQDFFEILWIEKPCNK